ncbi:MAG: PepSY domain-containing protein [Proteobacteria bacterium]|nr:PepSY domain-containing protein [Pseudomonadota bacterium]
MKSSFRKKLLWLHTWFGLTVGLVVVFLALTGAGFVLQPQLDDIVYRDLHVVPKCAAPRALDELAASARAVHPLAALHSIEMTTEDTASVAVMFSDKDYVYVDPCSARVLGVQNQYGGFFGVMDWLHRARFFTDLALGRTVAGWVSTLFLVILIGGGIALWWPRNRQALKPALKFNPRLPGTARTLSLHKFVGVYTALVLVVITVTGLPIGFEPVKNLIYSATGYVPPEKPKSKAAAEGVKRVPIETFWRKTRELFPEAEWVSLRYPAKPEAAYEAEILENGRPHSIAKSYHYMDAVTGETLKREHYYADQHIGRKIYLYCIAIHAGMMGGLPYQLLLLLASLGVGVQAYSGFSPYLRRKLRKPARTDLALNLVKRTVEAEDICSFEFADPQGKMLPPFSAGSHIDVTIGDGMVRQYSLCNDPQDTHRYVIGVLRHADSRGGSRALHDDLNVGDIVAISAPKNHFPLDHTAKRSLLLAGGIGVTPILCMAERLANTGADFTMHYCTRSVERTAFLDRIRRSSFAQRVSFHFGDGPAEQLIDIPALLDGTDPDTHLYVCGPSGFMDLVIAAARQKAWPDAQVHREYFSGAVQDSENNVAFDVKLASTGKIIHVAKEKTVVAALAESGIEIPTSCAEGVCGTCLTRVLDGEMEHRDRFLTAEERDRNDQFTPCCSRARSPMLVLDL